MFFYHIVHTHIIVTFIDSCLLLFFRQRSDADGCFQHARTHTHNNAAIKPKQKTKTKIKSNQIKTKQNQMNGIQWCNRNDDSDLEENRERPKIEYSAYRCGK